MDANDRSTLISFQQLASLAALGALLLLPACSPLHAQDQPQGQNEGQRGGRGMFGGQPPVRGTVTTVNGNVITIKTEQGETYQVQLSDNTRLMQNRQPIQASDIHPGDELVAIGQADAAKKTVYAAFAVDINADQAKKMREGLGKEWVAGKVTAIDGTTLTIQRVDGVTQKIEVDETTSFRKGRPGRENEPAASEESVTLADVKVGDNVMGRGGMKNNIFVPTMLSIMQGERRHHGGEAATTKQP